MKNCKVVTTSCLHTVPKKKVEFIGTLSACREKANYRAQKYQGSSVIYAPPCPKLGVRLIIETHLRDGEVIS
jgi:hypothetical protein